MSNKTPEHNVRTIVRNYLGRNGYDGLFQEDGECGCNLDELMTCDDACQSCMPAFEWECSDRCRDRGKHDTCAYGHGCMNVTKQPKEGE